jgi:hypothetical protein
MKYGVGCREAFGETMLLAKYGLVKKLSFNGVAGSRTTMQTKWRGLR